MSEAIPLDWIKRYIDNLLVIAEQLSDGALRDAVLLRTDHAMDLVKAWKEKP